MNDGVSFRQGGMSIIFFPFVRCEVWRRWQDQGSVEYDLYPDFVCLFPGSKEGGSLRFSFFSIPSNIYVNVVKNTHIPNDF